MTIPRRTRIGATAAAAGGPAQAGVGHGNGQLTVPLGTRATIDTAAATLTVEAGVRAVH
ncbi:hypothetical protein [Actinoplanes siamensis]|uniref:hypothetical protein n=1 Tax=Actinoplanes siamensis TaxID=1223317 RepID=UPI00194144C1|nr:hypothetical protein [Actinoplanes siamensis]